jgi:hypothetical protein
MKHAALFATLLVMACAPTTTVPPRPVVATGGVPSAVPLPPTFCPSFVPDPPAPPPVVSASSSPPSADPNACACATAQPSDLGADATGTCTDHIDEKEARAVLNALFPKHLDRSSQCPKASVEPMTWVEVDEIQAQNYVQGRFVPTIRQRRTRSEYYGGVGRFDYVIRVDNCQANTFSHLVFATFVPEELAAPRPKPISRCECHPLGDPEKYVPSCAKP